MGYDTVNNLLDLWRETNTVTDYLFSYFFLLSIFIIVMVAMQNWDKKNTITSATLATSIVAVLMFIAELIPQTPFVISLVLFGGSLMWLIFGGNE